MLKKTKSITLNGNSEIDGQPAVNLSATIQEWAISANTFKMLNCMKRIR